MAGYEISDKTTKTQIKEVVQYIPAPQAENTNIYHFSTITMVIVLISLIILIVREMRVKCTRREVAEPRVYYQHAPVPQQQHQQHAVNIPQNL